MFPPVATPPIVLGISSQGASRGQYYITGAQPTEMEVVFGVTNNEFTPYSNYGPKAGYVDGRDPFEPLMVRVTLTDAASGASGFHFLSSHRGGANFAFCDGGVRLMRYNARDLTPTPVSRPGGQVAQLPD